MASTISVSSSTAESDVSDSTVPTRTTRRVITARHPDASAIAGIAVVQRNSGWGGACFLGWGRMDRMTIQITGDAHADQILTDSPFALLVGMMLDQQYPMEHAFRGPAKVLDRFGSIEPSAIAAADPAEFKSLCSTPPAIHRFPGSMAERLWTEATSGADLLKRPMELPGFGKQKAQIFTALLAKQLDVRPEGWEKAVGDYSLDGYRSVADVTDPASLQKVREFKQQKKAAAKAQAV